jgi:hypothetical protein
MNDSLSAQVEDLGGGVENVERLTWGEAALLEGPYILESLREMGFPDRSISEALAIYTDWLNVASTREGSARLDESMYPRGFERLNDWFHGRSIEVIESQAREVRVPLFLLTAPPVTGCSVGLERKDTALKNVEWQLKFYGTGAEGVAEAKTSISVKFCAQEGQSKQAFLPVLVNTCRVAVKKRGKTIGTGFTYEADFISGMHPASFPTSRTNRKMHASAVGIFPLEKDDPESTTVYGVEVDRQTGRTLSLGFKAFNTEFSLKYRAQLSLGIALTCNLRGGHRYIARGVRDREGILWEVRNS